MPLPEIGTHLAHATETPTIYETENGALMAFIPLTTADDCHISARQCLVRKDGAVNQHGIKALKAFGWDGQLESIATLDWTADEVEIVVEQDGEYVNVQWINKPGSGGGKRPTPVNLQSVIAQHGAKFRALSPVVQTPAPAPAPVAAPAPNAPTSTMADAWTAFCAANDGKPQDDMNAAWFALHKQLHGDKPPAEFTPEDWGAIVTACNDNIPF